MTTGLFIAGTERGVGSTTVAAALAAVLVRRGLKVGVMKPVAVACPLDDHQPLELAGLPGQAQAAETLRGLNRLAALAGPAPPVTLAPQAALLAVEATRLLAAARTRADAELACPYRFAADLEPAAAARAAGRAIETAVVRAACSTLAADADVMLVDGTGGLMVPLDDEALMVDLVQQLELAVLLVAPSRVWGAINGCLMAAELLRRRDVPLAGVVLNRLTARPAGEEAVNPYQLEQHGLLVHGLLPWLEPAQLEDLDQLARRFEVHVDIDRILARIWGQTPG